MTLRLPAPLARVAELGHRVFTGVHSANLVVSRGLSGRPGDWDGLLHLAWIPAAGAGWTIRAWPCATRPGRPYLTTPPNPWGVALLEPGQYLLSHRRGVHKGRPALVQSQPVTVRRDPDRDSVLEPGSQLYTGHFGINVHDVPTPDGLAGCIGLSPLHMAEVLETYDELEIHQGPAVTLTLIEG